MASLRRDTGLVIPIGRNAEFMQEMKEDCNGNQGVAHDPLSRRVGGDGVRHERLRECAQFWPGALTVRQAETITADTAAPRPPPHISAISARAALTCWWRTCFG